MLNQLRSRHNKHEPHYNITRFSMTL